MRPDVSVVVVTHNGREMALRTLDSVGPSVGDVSAEWIFVDNDSSDGTPEAIEQRFPHVEVLRRPNLGFAAGNNAGFERVTGRYVLLLNPDIEVTRGTVADLIRAMDARPSVGAASVTQHDPTGRIYPSAWRFPSVRRQLGEALFARRWPAASGWQESHVDPAFYAQERSVDWLTGSFLVVRAAALQQTGQMDTAFFLYAEETDWLLRMRAHGWDVRHLPVMELVHHHGTSTRPELVAQLTYSKCLYARKHFGRPRRMAFEAALALRHIVRIALLAATGAARGERIQAERGALAVVVGGRIPRLGASHTESSSASWNANCEVQ